jgi:ribosomal protein L37AE/L43A
MAAPAAARPHLCCPFCAAYEVDRLYLGTLRVDACQCRACGAGWEEERLARRRGVGTSTSS